MLNGLQLEPKDDIDPSPFWQRRTATVFLSVMLGLVFIGTIAVLLVQNTEKSTVQAPLESNSNQPGYDGYMIAEREYLDELDRTVHGELIAFTNWLNSGQAKGMIGEIGWPGESNPDYLRWKRLADTWMADVSQTDMKVLYWAAGRHWGSNYPLSAYSTVDDRLTMPYAQALSIESNLPESGLGINLAGLEFSVDTPFSAANPGVEGTNFFKPREDDFSFLASRGYNIIRLPFRWERLQPTLNGPLDPAYLAHLQEAVASASKYDLEIILDMHNYGEYKSAEGRMLYLGSNELTHDHFSDAWVKISDSFNGTEGIYYGLMNEPRDMPPGAAGNPARNWEAASQSALRAIRSNNDTSPILVAGYNWSKVKTWTRQHPSPWIQDPANNFYYEGHHYWDADETGTYRKSYDDALRKVRT